MMVPRLISLPVAVKLLPITQRLRRPPSVLRVKKFHLENKLEDGKSIIPSEAMRKQSEADNGMISAMALS